MDTKHWIMFEAHGYKLVAAPLVDLGYSAAECGPCIGCDTHHELSRRHCESIYEHMPSHQYGMTCRDHARAFLPGATPEEARAYLVARKLEGA